MPRYLSENADAVQMRRDQFLTGPPPPLRVEGRAPPAGGGESEAAAAADQDLGWATRLKVKRFGNTLKENYLHLCVLLFICSHKMINISYCYDLWPPISAANPVRNLAMLWLFRKKVPLQVSQLRWCKRRLLESNPCCKFDNLLLLCSTQVPNPMKDNVNSPVADSHSLVWPLLYPAIKSIRFGF